MRLFAIHAPMATSVSAGLEGARAARTGFSVAALVFGPLWLLARGLWLALAGYVLAAVVIAAFVGYGAMLPGADLGLFALAQVYLGFEGRALAVVARARNGRPLVDVVYAHSALEAEKVYLERALASAARGAPEIIGLFPEARR